MGENNGSHLRGPVLEDLENKKTKSPDTELRTDDEKDTLYDDGLDVEDDSETLIDTHGNKMPS